MSTLELRREAGGERHYLDGKPVHCGDGLELLLPGDPTAAAALRQLAERYVDDRPHRHVLEQIAVGLEHPWRRVRYEVEHCVRGKRPVLYLAVGGDWERWTPPPGKREGDDIVVPCDDCNGEGEHRAGGRCPWCAGKGERPVVAQHRDGRDASGLAPCDYCAGKGVLRTTVVCDWCDGRKTRVREVFRPEPPWLACMDAYPDFGELRGVQLRWPRRPTEGT